MPCCLHTFQVVARNGDHLTETQLFSIVETDLDRANVLDDERGCLDIHLEFL